jgi:hypothetical protein
VLLLSYSFAGTYVECDAPRIWGDYFQDSVGIKSTIIISTLTDYINNSLYVFITIAVISIALVLIINKANIMDLINKMDSNTQGRVNLPIQKIPEEQKCIHPASVRLNLPSEDKVTHQEKSQLEIQKCLGGFRIYPHPVGSRCGQCGTYMCQIPGCICKLPR